MAEDAQYETHKRKYEEDTSPPPPRRRPTGFSAPIISPDSDGPPPTAAPYGDVPPPLNEFEIAKKKLQELASRAFNSETKRSFDNGGFTSDVNSLPDQKPVVSNIQVGSAQSIPASSGYSRSKTIEIPNGRVGVIIGKAGETIKYIQIQSGARIQVTRDADHDPNLPNRIVELMGNQDQIAKAEQLIKEVLSEADTGGPGVVSRRQPGAAGSEQFMMKVPSNKVGLVIGKGGETIKNIQSRSGARVQVIPLHPPPGETFMERTVQIDGTVEQIEIAKQMVNEVIENRLRNPAMAGAYPQQGYQARPPTSWAPQPPQMQQPGGYGYMQQPGPYPGATSQYNQQAYSGYSSQPTPGGYPQTWDQSNALQSQQAPQGTGYDYYGQQQPPTQQQHMPGGPQTDNTGYNYNQPPASGGYSQPGYSQDGYGGGYLAAPTQPGYGQPPANPQSGYGQQPGYGSTPGYGNPTNASAQDGHPSSYSAQGETGQMPSSVPPQQGYMGQPSPNPYPTHGTNQPTYGMPPASQPGYGTPSTPQGGYGPGPGYGPPQGQRTPPNPSAYGQPQQSPSQVGGYAPPASGQSGYPPSQPPAQTGAAAAAYGGVTTQPGAYPPPYGAQPVTPPSYGQQPPAYYDGSYAYPADGSGAAAAPDSQPAVQPGGAAKASPQN